jgi:type III secretory pathway component EscU
MKDRLRPFRWIIRGAIDMVFDTILIIIACIIGVAVVGAVVLWLLGVSDWINRGSH